MKLRGLYVSLGGLSADLENSVKLLNAYASANCRPFMFSKDDKSRKVLLRVIENE